MFKESTKPIQSANGFNLNYIHRQWKQLDMPVDPVCSMHISEDEAETAVSIEEEVHYFCSTHCHNAFMEEPGDYLDSPHPHLQDIQGVEIPHLPSGIARGEFEFNIQDASSLRVGDMVKYTKAMNEKDVIKFAEATGDTNAVHLSDDFAKKTRFGRRIVHGTLVSGMISATLACFPGLSIYLSQNLEFKKPVDIGEELIAICEITEVMDSDRYRMKTQVKNSDDELVVDGSASILIDEIKA